MPSEHRRRKDDTWTQDELNKALKGPKEDMHRRKKHEDDGEKRSRHHDESDKRRHRDDDNRSHKRDDEKEKRHHRKRDDSSEKQLTEEERERQRRERREKREGGKEEKKSRPKEKKSEQKIELDDDSDDRRRRRTDDDPNREKRHHRDGESKRHRDDESKRHRDDESKRHRDDESKRHRDDDNRKHRDGESRRHRDEDTRERRHHDGDGDGRRRHREEDSSSRRHRGEESNGHQRHEESSHSRRRHEDEGSSRRHRTEEDEDEKEQEKRRQERRERKEREKRKEKEAEKEKVSERDERHERSERHDRHRDKEEKPERRRSKPEATPPVNSVSSNGRVGQHQSKDEDGDNDYNYEEDFEDYEDDFEDDEDPEMKEEGEMEEVLRALDEENNRLQSDSRRSNWSDSTELSDERFKENREEEERKSRAAPRGKTFINFVSAKQRVMDQSAVSLARKRFDDLSKLIELDVAKYDMFDLPPVKEYELYIRSFGRSDTRQAYVQTHDDDIERDVQTDEIESLSKWTQHPPDQDEAVGGEGITVVATDESKQHASKVDPERMTQFLDRVGQFLFTILDEESEGAGEERDKRNSEPKASFSLVSWQLGNLDFLEGRQITNLAFCPSDPNSLLSIHSSYCLKQEETRPDLCEIRTSSPVQDPSKKTYKIDSLYLVCVWNLSQSGYPYRICASEMQINCACFSPTKASLVFAGMEDGSMTLWDLREPASQHKTLEHKDRGHLVRFPTYMTAGVLEVENHCSPVVCITPVSSIIVGSLKDEETAESRSGLSFQLASIEQKATMNLWVVAEIAIPDHAGSQNDLGLSPGGKIKLLKSSSIVINNPNKYLSNSTELHALSVHLNPGDLNHFYVPTDSGCVVHGIRFGKTVYPQGHSSLVDSPVPVVSLDFSPFGHPYFLTACKDGTLHLFNTKIEHPISSWKDFISGETILSVRWSHSRPAVFFVLDNNSTMFTFDLVENGLAPMKTDTIRTADARCLEIGSDPNLLTAGVSKPAHIALALDNGTIECMTVSDELRQQQPLEEEFLASYSDRY